MNTRPLIVLRPEPGCTATVAAARALGLEAVAFPLFDTVPRDWQPPAADAIDALLIGSGNALRLAGPALARFAGKAVYAVGEVTALACRAAGLELAAVGSGGLQPVLDRVSADHPRLLRLCGEERMPLTPPAGVTLIEHAVYACQPRPLPAPLALLLTARALSGAVVLLHSGEAARHFAAEVDRLSIPRPRIHIAALAPRIAAAAGAGWATVATATAARDEALLALAWQLCQDSGGTGKSAETLQ